MKNSFYGIIVLLIGAMSLSGQSKEETVTTDEVTVPIVTEETLTVSEPIIETQEQMVETQEPISLGVCKLTAYCCENYPHICNDGDSTKTATGTRPTPGRTCAVDPRVIPYGSEVIINGHTYIAEDCGGAIKGNKIDIVFATHKEALDFGVQYADVQFVTP